MNEFEKACREWIKGCSVSLFTKTKSTRECEECTTAFLNHIEKLCGEDVNEDMGQAKT